MNKNNGTGLTSSTANTSMSGITSSTARLTERQEGQSTDTASFGQFAKMGVMSILLATTPMVMTSCGEKTEINAEDPNALNEEQQAFKNLLTPHPDGTLKYSTLEGGVEPYVFKNFAKVNLELLNAKILRYRATPILQKKSIADVLAKAKELNPGQERYGISLSLVKKTGNTESVLTPTVFVTDIKGVSGTSPCLDDLSNDFGLDIFNKLNPQSPIPTTFNLNKGEELIVRIFIGDNSNIFSNFNFGVNPINSVN